MLDRLSKSAFFSTLLFLGVVGPYFDTAKAEEPERTVKGIKMTTAELRAAGINIRTTKSNALPHSCAAAGNAKLSISDDILAHFKARGYSLESVCLALSSNMRFDMETGKQLPLAVLTDSAGREVPLNFPDCFKDGTPYLDCRQEYESNWGSRLTESDKKGDYSFGPMTEREYEQKLDELFRAYIAHKKVSGRFSFEDLGRGSSDSRFEWILASKVLPRGYGYALHGGEGDDPEHEDVDLETYRKKSSLGAIWSGER